MIGGFISSYKGHSLFALILSLLFFLNPISIAMALIGANLPDFDHDIKKINLYRMEIAGLLLFIVLYIANLPYLIGIILCILPLVFYFSNHRGFTHSLLGIVFLSVLVFLLVVMGLAILSPILSGINVFNGVISSEILCIVLIIIFLAILVLNKRLIVPFLVLFLLGILFFPNGIISLNLPFYSIFEGINGISFFGLVFSQNMIQMVWLVFIPLFLGLLSHLILDSASPAGIELFRPFSSKKFHLSYLKLLILVFFLYFFFFFFFFFFVFYKI